MFDSYACSPCEPTVNPFFRFDSQCSQPNLQTGWQEELVCSGTTTLRRIYELNKSNLIPTGRVYFYTVDGVLTPKPTSFTLGSCGSTTGGVDAGTILDLQGQIATLQAQIAALQNSGVGSGTDFVTEYETTLTGNLDGVNQEFMTTRHFVFGSLVLYYNGQRLQPGQGFDYFELGPNRFQFTFAPAANSFIAAEYIPLP